jgi:hypothetical protein
VVDSAEQREDSMTVVLRNAADSGEHTEVHELVKTVVIKKANNFYRIEVLKGYSNPSIPFTAMTYVQKESADGHIWVNWSNAPWTARDTADGALAQAIGFLPQRHLAASQ